MAEIIIKKSNNDREFQLSCLWDEEKLYFCKNAQTTLTCSVEMLTRSVAISSHLNEVNLNNFVSSLTRWVISWKLAPVLEVEQVGAV